MLKYIIAIDGPAASGKSSTAEEVAKRLGFDRVNSGLIYRAITYILLKNNSDFNIEDKNVRDFVNNLKIVFRNRMILYEGEDISQHLRTSIIDKKVGLVAKELYIRKKAQEIQQDVLKAVKLGAVIDGRDIGTVVLPDAFLKIFITASPETRAKRRKQECPGDFNEILKDIKERDEHDINRIHGPLRCADDAIVITNDNMTFEDVVEVIIKEFEKKKSLVNK